MTLYRVNFHEGYVYYKSEDEAEKAATFRDTFYEPVEININLLNEYEERLSNLECNFNNLVEWYKDNHREFPF